jgi:branched-chain amino acid transport system permease protein
MTAGSLSRLGLVVLPALVALALLTPLWISDYAVEIGFRLLTLFCLCEAWNLLAGYGGLVSLGSGAFVGLGGYVLVGFLNNAGNSVALALAAGAVGCALFAALVAPAMFRMRGLYFTVGTLALGEGLRLFMVNSPLFGGAMGLFFQADPPDLRTLYVYAFVVFAAVEIAQSVLTASRLSLMLRAVRDDEGAATQMGAPAFKIKFVAFVATSALMGIVGGLMAMRLGAIEPYGMFSVNWSMNVALAAIIGGLGYRLGAIVGATTVTAMSEALADYPQVNLALTGVLLIVIVRLAPSGVCGLAAQTRQFRASRDAARAPASEKRHVSA